MSPQTLTDEERVRIHERIQEATGLISQAEDDLPREMPAKEELRKLGRRVWEIGYEILGAVRYSQVDELAKIISDLDEEQPFLSAGDDQVTDVGPGEIDVVLDASVSPRRVAERILERVRERARP